MTEMKTTMRAAALDGFGGVEMFRMRELPVPDIGADDVLIRVRAAGVGSWDALEREGGYDGLFGLPASFPYVLGWDAAGTVAAVGADVSRVAVGDRVYAATMPLPRGGCYAEYVVVPQEHVAHMHDGLTMEQAGAMPWDALTALSGLDVLALQPGATVMVFGASGGIGHFAVQLARASGARVLAVASGPDGVALVARLGADAAVDGRRDGVVAAARAFAPEGLDAALLTAGGEAAEHALGALRYGARVAVPNGVVPVPADRSGLVLVSFDGARDQAGMTRLNELIAAGPFDVHIDATYSLDQAAAAHRRLSTHYVGKLVLRVP